jgi:hypothetical protein
MVLQNGILLSCTEENFKNPSKFIEEKSVFNKALNASSFMNNTSKRTKSSDLIRINDSVNNLNLSLSNHQIRPIVCQVESKQTNGKGLMVNNPITSPTNDIGYTDSLKKNSHSKTKIDDKTTSCLKVLF